MTIPDPQLPALTTRVQETSQYATTQPDFARFGEVVDSWRRRRWLMLCALVTIFGLGMLLTLLKHPIYEASSTIVVNATKPSRSDDVPLISNLQALTQARSVDTQLQILSSASLLTEAFSRLTLQQRLQGFRTDRTPYGLIHSAVKQNTDIIKITVRAYTPEAAAALANNIAQTYFKRDIEQNRQAIRLTREYVERQLSTMQAQFDDANRQFADYKKQTGLVSPDTQVAKVAEAMALLRRERDEVTNQITAEQHSHTVLQREIEEMQGSVAANTTVGNNPRFLAAIQHIDELYEERTRLLKEYTPNTTEIQDLDGRIREEEERLRQISETVVVAQTSIRHPVRDELLSRYAGGLANIAANQAKLRSITQALRAQEEQTRKLPEQEMKLLDLRMQLDMLKNDLSLLAEKHRMLLISEQSTLSNGFIVTSATPPGSPISPNIKLNALLSLLLGLLGAMIVAMIAERADTRIYLPDVAEKLTGLPILGTIHAIGSSAAKIIDARDTESRLLEQYRILRNNLLFSIDRTVRLLAITSVSPAEGKTTCSYNLGVAMALDGKRVLVVDCDLHRPSLHTLLKAPRDPGLTDVVLGGCSLTEAIIATGREGLELLPAGHPPANSTEFLNAQPTRRLFSELAEQYDIVILDCPPCLKLSDMQVISTMVDGELLLLTANMTNVRALELVYRALNMVGAPLLGLVANRFDSRQCHGYYTYDNYYDQYLGIREQKHPDESDEKTLERQLPDQ